jgi:hypothetical protein
MLKGMKAEEPGTADQAADPPGGAAARQPNLPPAPDGYTGSCLRPRGLCELGGCCDLCLHNPDQERKREG